MIHKFTKLGLLQIIDGILLTGLLGALTLLIWYSLTNVANQAHDNMQTSVTSLQDAHTSFQDHMQFESLVDSQRETFEDLNNEFFKFAFDPNSDPQNLPYLQQLAQQLESSSKDLLQHWPERAEQQLRSDYEEAIGITIMLVNELNGLSPAHWRQLASDARNTIMAADQLMHKIEDFDNHLGVDLDNAVQKSIIHTLQNTQQTSEQLNLVKYQTLMSTLVLTTLLIGSRWFFSTRFKSMTYAAQKAQAVAEEAVKTKARFLATMSHEIRTPMNGVIGMTRLLMNTPMSKKQMEFVESIQLSGEHLLTVINDVLDFSKIEAGRLDLKHEPLELRTCIEDVLNLLSSKALEKNLELAYAVGPSIPLFIEGDIVRLRQILTNLIGNAIKFTERGEVTVFVIPRSRHEDVYELEFQINDTGPGIPTNRLESIFEQFNRAEDTLSIRHEGTGLGLAISRRLVEMMEGKIWANSEIGVGSCFHFTLKARKMEGQLKPQLYTNIPEIIGKRVLIVENNPANHQTLQNYCTEWGATTEAACSAAEAIAWIASGKTYDIGLIESNLPQASALDLAQYIRKHFTKQQFPLILIAPPNDSHPKNLVRELFNLYLTKPLTRSRLFDSLMIVLGELNLVRHKLVESSIKLGERLPLNILLAEDNPINQIVAASILDEMAYKVDIVENGLQAIAALRKKPYQVILMDMQMPEMGGLEATRHIRAEFAPERQPIIIAMTANAMEGDKQSCLDAGMNDYISKPVLPETVEATLQRWFEKSLPVEA